MRTRFNSVRMPMAVFLLLLELSLVHSAWALGGPQIVAVHFVPNGFALAEGGRVAPLLVSSTDWPGVLRAVDSFAGDIQRVSGLTAAKLHSTSDVHIADCIVIGTLGHSALIEDLVSRHKLDISSVAGQWEAGVTQVVEEPFPGIHRALVIVGADKRGTIFGLYTLSEQIGVSPWYWWADVRVPHHDALYVLPGPHRMPSPAVKYRGIFLNDEAPSLSGWTQEKFGGKNHQFYEHVFELLLRLRANYLWPAMWANAFNEDDLADPQLADEYGIVMGTSHHEPMLRAQQEWKRHGSGPWDYAKNAAVLDDFWGKGITRNKEYESTITIGMRGDGDMAMSSTANTALLEHIVADQRKIIAANADGQIQNPQIWALYKEVQEYYEKGMRVPKDVTLLWCDDNWGNIRRLPIEKERQRPGGAGIYYHFDYVGDPRSYKWLNTYNITKVWEQMNLAVEYKADRVWIVNVGDLKPMEFPIEFFLTMARDPNRWGKDGLQDYTTAWATREFGPEHALEIAELVSLYTKYNSRRKPEQLEPTTYSLTEDHEADRVDAEWRDLAARADNLMAVLPPEERPSFFELVLYPLKASATVCEMYIAAGRNRLYAKQGRVSTNFWADETRRLFEEDAALSDEYNHRLMGGKWDHMMDQTHIGYTFWNEPPANAMPAVQQIQPQSGPRLAVIVEGSDAATQEMPMFDEINRQTRTLELAYLGTESVHFEAKVSAPWILLDRFFGDVTKDLTLQVSVDWKHAPAGYAKGTVTVIPQGAQPTVVHINALKPVEPASGFVENAGIVTMDAEHATAKRSATGVSWRLLPDFGETLSAMETFPVTAASTLSGTSQACMDYVFTVFTTEERTLQTVLAPTLSFVPLRGLRYGVALDGKPETIVDAWSSNTDADWQRAVSDGVHRVTTNLGLIERGSHVLHFCRVDAGVVLERLLINAGPPNAEYLGPPESKRAATLFLR
jgi:hypothetical protein